MFPTTLMEVKASPMANPAAITEAAEITSLWAECVDSNTGSALGHCKRRKISSNSDTEASSSCNLERAKQPRKCQELKRQKLRTQELGEQYYNNLVASLIFNSSHMKHLLEAAATVVDTAPHYPKTIGSPFFAPTECVKIEEILREKHQIIIPDYKVVGILNTLYFEFKDYCKLMKRGRSGLRFNWENGVVYRKEQLERHDAYEFKLKSIEHLNIQAILNFDGLKKIYQCVWDKYFKDVDPPHITQSKSCERSRSTMKFSSSKTSRHTDSLKSFSSVNNRQNYFGVFVHRLRELFDKGPFKYLPKAYVEATLSHYNNDRECQAFLAYDDDTAKRNFLSKIGPVMKMNG